MDEVQGSLLECPYYRIYPENPLHLGFYLSSIGNGMYKVQFKHLLSLTVIIDNSTDLLRQYSGDVIYKKS